MSVRDFIPNDGSLWSIRAYDISGNYDQAIDLDPSSNFSFSRNGSTIATLGSNLITPSSASLYNGLNVSGTYFSNSVSAIQIPADTSANRPAGQSGYVRYNTGENIIEYWNNNSSILAWIPISEPSPVFTNISPSYVSEDASSVFYTITGSNFNTFSTVHFVGNIDLVEYPVSSSTFVNSSTITCNITSTIADNSNNNTYFAIKITNSNTGFTTTSGFIVPFNPGPFWNTAASAVLGTGVSGTSYTVATSPFTDLSASDVGNLNTPVTYYATTSPLNGSATLVTLDASSGKLVGTMPSPTVTTNYGFSAYAQDASSALSPNRSFFFTVSPPALTFVSGTALPSPIYVDSSNNIVGGPVVGGFIIYRFVVSSNQYTSTTFGFTINKTTPSINFLCVGGGGGAAAYNSSGGGGAGGFRTSFSTNTGTSGGGGALESSISLTNGTTYTVTVGGGSQGSAGNGGSFSGSPNTVSQGLASSISGSGLTTIISYGGSPGACNQGGATKPQDYVNQPATGSQPSAGSGGGARGEVAAPGGTNTNVGGTGTAGQGFNGGSNALYSGNYPGGGGGGAGSVGQSLSADTFAGAGGSGIQTAITGTAQFYAGGGGGSTQASGASDVGGGGSAPAGAGGSSVGGNGRGTSSSPLSGFSGTANTGSGGGAGCNANPTADSKGGDGSAGIVVIRFPSY
jgi:hypothetical protein